MIYLPLQHAQLAGIVESLGVRTKESARAHSQVIDFMWTLMVRMLEVSVSDDTGASPLIAAYTVT